MDYIALILQTLVALFCLYWFYTVVTNKQPVRTDTSKADKIFVCLVLVVMGLSAGMSALEFFTG